MKTAVFPGTFDPITNGHLNLIQKAVVLFDVVIVAILHNPQKTPLFAVDERRKLIEETVADLTNVRVESFQGLLVDFVKQVGADAVLRGLRDAGDFPGEFRMAQMNQMLFPELTTLFVPTDIKYAAISSSLVREVVRYGGDASALVPPPVWMALQNRLGHSGN